MAVTRFNFNARLQPMHRVSWFDEPLQAHLPLGAIVFGSETELTGSGEPYICAIEVDFLMRTPWMVSSNI
jgi:hypothetical protein